MNQRAVQTLISRMTDKIDAQISEFVDRDKPLALVDFPDHSNCGDSAIWLGEIAWLKKRFGKAPSYVSRMHDFDPSELGEAVPDGPIFIHGGGNFGDIWPQHMNFKEQILKAFPERLVVQLPQSLHYDSIARLEQTARVIEKHKNFVLLVRDTASERLASQYFQCEVRLCPDMAFAIGGLKPAKAEIDVLVMLREDKEGIDHERRHYDGITEEDWIQESARAVRVAKLGGFLSAGFSSKQRRNCSKLTAAAHQRVDRGLRQIARGKVLITDRLHVHICSTLLGRPHAVLDNYYGKIGRLMDSFYPEGTSITHRPDTLQNAVEWAREEAAKIT